MTTPTAFVDSVAFTAGQQHMARRIGEILRFRRTLVRNSALPKATQVILVNEIEATIRAIEEAAV